MPVRSILRERSDAPSDDGKDKATQALGAKGGRKRAESMSPERRAIVEIMGGDMPAPKRGPYKARAIAG